MGKGDMCCKTCETIWIGILEWKVKLTSLCFPIGDGTMLLAASKVFDKFKPVIGVNTDPER